MSELPNLQMNPVNPYLPKPYQQKVDLNSKISLNGSVGEDEYNGSLWIWLEPGAIESFSEVVKYFESSEYTEKITAYISEYETLEFIGYTTLRGILCSDGKYTIRLVK